MPKGGSALKSGCAPTATGTGAFCPTSPGSRLYQLCPFPLVELLYPLAAVVDNDETSVSQSDPDRAPRQHVENEAEILSTDDLGMKEKGGKSRTNLTS